MELLTRIVTVKIIMITMKKSRIALMAVMGIAAIACTKEPVNTPVDQDVNLVAKTFTAGAEAETKVALGEDGLSLNWKSGDEIMVLTPKADDAGVTANTFSTSDNGPVANFTGLTIVDAPAYYAVYPSSAVDKENAWTSVTTTTNGETKTTAGVIVTIPSVQQAVHNSFDPKAFVATAEAEGDHFQFKTIISAIKFQLGTNAADVEKIVFKGKDYTDDKTSTKDANIAGKGVITVDALQSHKWVSGTSEAAYTITLNAPADGFKSDATYYIALRPNNCPAGIELYFFLKDGSVCKAINSNSLYNGGSLGTIKNLGTLDPSRFSTITPYEAYNLGLPITIAGKEYTKTDFGGSNATLISTENQTINTPGVYFVNPSISDLKLSTKTYDNLAIISNSNSRINITFTGTVGFNKNAVVAFKNLTINNPSNDHVFTHANAKALLFDNCAINVPSNKEFIYNGGARIILKFAMYNCDVKVTGNGRKILFVASKSGEQDKYGIIEFENNIFYNSSDIKNFELFDANTTTITDLKICNNSFINVYPSSTSGYSIAYSLSNSFKASKNLFDLPNYKTIVNATYRWMYKSNSGTTDKDKTYQGYPVENNCSFIKGHFYFGETMNNSEDNQYCIKALAHPNLGADYPSTTKAYSEKDFNTFNLTKNTSVDNSIGATR